MKPMIVRVFVLGPLLLVFLAQPVFGQDPPPETPPPARPDSISLVFEREVFFYPQYERRDPFAPLLNSEDTGPRFEGLRLFSVIESSNPAHSVALLGPRSTGQDNSTEEVSGRMYRVRRGDRLGNIRILQIQATRILVDVEEFGMREQRIMELQRPGQGGLL